MFCLEDKDLEGLRQADVLSRGQGPRGFTAARASSEGRISTTLLTHALRRNTRCDFCVSSRDQYLSPQP